MNNVIIGGAELDVLRDDRRRPGRERGAAPAPSGVHVGMSNTLNTPIEALELEFPLRVERYELRYGSGGDGEHRGGDGIVRALRVLEPATLSLLTDRRRHAPAGRAGGGPGACGGNLLDGNELPAKVTAELERRRGGDGDDARRRRLGRAALRYEPMSVRVRMAPSPTGFVHIGTVRTFLFNWLFARQQGGVCLLRIENTDTSREVEDAVEQIQELAALARASTGTGPCHFQLDTADKARELAEQLVREDKAYEDEGAIRFRQPREGSVWWDDAVRGRIEFQNDKLADLVIVRADGRPTYNFVSPVDDIADEITHVIRGQDHVSNTPTQINILRALGADLPVYAHVPDVLGNDGKKLSKRHGAVSVDGFRELGYLPDALVNFIALLGWSYDDKTTVMSRARADRAVLARAGRARARRRSTTRSSTG